ncbi:(2Fe-2S)-binding protein [Nakamurella sp. YIM 132087]|uniref:(2Fe-2S)-binding protein n=1 Tax=Nakamurella alba TaxID=2665158 RepID=A0A7K1FSN6_9ACTN|nr:(2Fe-2S)-binding protein [Nakamurella alba]MTD17165.1 (2Fe-2S)-binding protein [Nakamurella alba]
MTLLSRWRRNPDRTDGRLPGVVPGRAAAQLFSFTVDDRPVTAYPGETIAAAAIAAGIRVQRRGVDGSARGLYCGIGVCGECEMSVDGRFSVRTCVEPAEPGADVRTGGAGDE